MWLFSSEEASDWFIHCCMLEGCLTKGTPPEKKECFLSGMAQITSPPPFPYHIWYSSNWNGKGGEIDYVQSIYWKPWPRHFWHVWSILPRYIPTQTHQATKPYHLTLGVPSFTKSAVFFNTVQKAVDPTPPSFWTLRSKFFWWISWKARKYLSWHNLTK